MTNHQIIFLSTCRFLGIAEDQGAEMLLHGTFPTYHTYEAWKQAGRQVQKGQKASFSARIWKSVQQRDENGKITQRMIFKTAYFFGLDQTAPIA